MEIQREKDRVVELTNETKKVKALKKVLSCVKTQGGICSSTCMWAVCVCRGEGEGGGGGRGGGCPLDDALALHE